MLTVVLQTIAYICNDSLQAPFKHADELMEICKHLKQHDITSVAMESTGNYWQNFSSISQNMLIEI